MISDKARQAHTAIMIQIDQLLSAAVAERVTGQVSCVIDISQGTPRKCAVSVARTVYIDKDNK